MNYRDVFDSESHTEKLSNVMKLMSGDYFDSANHYIPRSNKLEANITIYLWVSM